MSVSSWNHPCALKHQHDYLSLGTRPVNHSPGNKRALTCRQRYGVSALNIDHQAPGNYEEELVLIVVLVPVEVSLDDSKPNDAVVDGTYGLVEPRFRVGAND